MNSKRALIRYGSLFKKYCEKSDKRNDLEQKEMRNTQEYQLINNQCLEIIEEMSKVAVYL